MTKTVSIVIPTYNCAAFITEAVVSALRQSTPCEVIVVDDGSTDATREVLGQIDGEFTFLPQENSGVAAARNNGLERARGNWILFLDSDDRLPPRALEQMLARAGQRQDVVIYGDRDEIDEAGRHLRRYPARECTGTPPVAAQQNFDGAAFSPGCALVPRSLAMELGGFDRRFSTCADRHFWIRLGAIAEFLYAEGVTYEYRIRGNSMSADLTGHAIESVLVRLDALEWCRQRGVRLFEREPTPAEILGSDLSDFYWARRWDCFDSLAALADKRQIDSSGIRALRGRRRLGPALIALKDRCDRLLNRNASTKVSLTHRSPFEL